MAEVLKDVLKTNGNRTGRKVAKTGLGLIAAFSAMTGCAGESKSTEWTVGVECTDGSNVRVLGAEAPGFNRDYDDADISLTCSTEEGENSAPRSIALLSGEGTKTNNPGVTYEEVAIAADYTDGGFDTDQDPKIAWSVVSQDQPEMAVINVDGVNQIDRVEILGEVNG